MVADSFSGATFVYGEGGDDEIAANGEGGQLADGGSGDDIVNAGGFAGNGTGLGGSGTDIIRFQTFLGGHGDPRRRQGRRHDRQPAGRRHCDGRHR